MEDKKHQIMMMRDIFSRYIEVVIYLGELPSGNPNTGNSATLLAEKTRPITWYGDNRDEDIMDMFWDDFIVDKEGYHVVEDMDNLDMTFHAFALIGALADVHRSLYFDPPTINNEGRLLCVCSKFVSRLASEDVDKVYALLSLVNN